MFVQTTPTHTITHTPKGFRIVMAPGLTTAAPRNPCLSCNIFGRDMDTCATNCMHAAARDSYLDHVGAPDRPGVDPTDSYGFGF